MPLFRYHRQELLPGFGPESSAAMARSHAMVIGCGALGTVAAEMLARAGVGRLSLIDRDVVEVTNLQRQTLFDEDDARAARPKAEAAAARLTRVNSSIVIDPIVDDLNPSNADRLVSSHPPPHVLLDCTDNFVARYLLNDLAVKHSIPLCYGGAIGTRGTQFTILPGRTACLRCVFPQPPAPGDSPTCDTAGVLASATTIVAACQATDAIKVLLGHERHLPNSLLSFDLWTNDHRRIDLSAARRADCPCCGGVVGSGGGRRGEGRFEFLDGSAAPRETVLCGRNSVQISAAAPMNLDALHARLARVGSFERTPSHVRGRVDGGSGGATGPLEITVFADGRAIIGGTTDPAVARAAFDRLVGS
ncbi:MAG: ThiF family adenylyltransferase [Phycisphaerales bacterium]